MCFGYCYFFFFFLGKTDLQPSVGFSWFAFDCCFFGLGLLHYFEITTWSFVLNTSL